MAEIFNPAHDCKPQRGPTSEPLRKLGAERLTGQAAFIIESSLQNFRTPNLTGTFPHLDANVKATCTRVLQVRPFPKPRQTCLPAGVRQSIFVLVQTALGGGNAETKFSYKVCLRLEALQSNIVIRALVSHKPMQEGVSLQAGEFELLVAAQIQKRRMYFVR